MISRIFGFRKIAIAISAMSIALLICSSTVKGEVGYASDSENRMSESDNSRQSENSRRIIDPDISDYVKQSCGPSKAGRVRGFAPVKLKAEMLPQLDDIRYDGETVTIGRHIEKYGDAEGKSISVAKDFSEKNHESYTGLKQFLWNSGNKQFDQESISYELDEERLSSETSGGNDEMMTDRKKGNDKNNDAARVKKEAKKVMEKTVSATTAILLFSTVAVLVILDARRKL